jgi:phage shock protein PspC (stress-responsive transcriptional regulator)
MLKLLGNTEFATQEGTLYPLLSKMRRENLVDYEWRESGNRAAAQVLQSHCDGPSAARGSEQILETHQRHHQRYGKEAMNKVITINLNGNAYSIEERGYESLLGYLDAAEAQLKDNPDRAEIVSDLEQAIAEKCRNFLTPQKTVVTSAEIDQIIKEMGPVEADAESGSSDAKDSGPASSAHRTQGTSKGPKRLYRIREGQQIEGVCMGLAVYFGLDVTIVRLIFVALAIASGGIGVGVYFVMMVVVPYADTAEQQAQAYGTQFNAQEFIDQAKEHYASFKKDGEKWAERAKEKTHDWRRSWRYSFGRNRNRWRPAYPPPPPSTFHGAAMPVFGVLIGVISIVWILAVISVINTHAIFGWPLPLRIPGWVAIVILLILLNIVIGPFKYMRDARYNHPFGPIAALFTSLVWMAFLIFIGWFAYTHSLEVRHFLQNLPDVWDEIVHH